jgi:hypothetical protein
MNLSGFLILPVSPQLKREIKLDGPWTGTVDGAAAAIPAFFRMQDDRRLALFGMRYIDINLTRFHAGIASVTDFRIEYHRIIRCSDVGKRKYFFL